MSSSSPLTEMQYLTASGCYVGQWAVDLVPAGDVVVRDAAGGIVARFTSASDAIAACVAHNAMAALVAAAEAVVELSADWQALDADSGWRPALVALATDLDDTDAVLWPDYVRP